MAGKGETVKYVIDADVSAFIRGMLEADAASKIAGKSIEKNLGNTAKRSENNFKDIRRSAGTAASSIRNFTVAFSAFNVTSAIIGITALSGALLELSGAIAAAGSTSAVLVPIFAQLTAGSLAFKAGVSGLGQAFKAIGKNDGQAFQKSLQNLGPAATSVAYAVGGLNKALNSIKLNTQQALLAGIGDTLLKLGANTLPTVNAGFQVIGQSINRTLKEAASLAGSPMFNGLLNAVFSDTARTIDTLTGALAPLLTMFTDIYLITAPYVQLLAQYIVNLTKAGAAFLSTSKGQSAFNLAIMEGVVALQQIGSLVSAVFNFLISIFRTSVTSGNSLIATLTGIVRSMTAWVNSAKGQAQLNALFQFTALTVRTVASALGAVLSTFFDIIQAVSSLNPVLQQMIVNFLVGALVVRPIVTYFTTLYLAFRTLIVTVFNLAQQLKIMFVALGGITSIVLVAALGLIFLGNVIRGPLGAALIIVGSIIAAYIGLSYLLGLVSAATAPAVAAVGAGGIAAGAGLSVAARGAAILQAALLPLLILAASVLTILGMLGLFSGKAKSASTATTGLGSSLGALQKSLKGVGSSGNKAAGGGLSNLASGLNDVGSAADSAQGSLAGFDKMNVLTSNNAAGAGIGGLPALPSADLGGLGGGGLAMPEIDTGDFDKTLKDMMGNFEDLKNQFDTPFSNPFKTIGEWLTNNFVPALIILGGIVAVIGAVFIAFGFSAVVAAIGLSATIGLVILAVAAVIAIVILLWQNWGKIWQFMQDAAKNVLNFLILGFNNFLNFAGGILVQLGNFFTDAFNGIKFVWSVVVDFFAGLFSGIYDKIVWYVGLYIQAFKLAWEGIKIIWSVAVSWFQGVWNGIGAVFGVVGTFFSNVFKGAWNAITAAFGSVGSFFSGVWNTIVSIFGSVGTAIGNAIGGAFKGVVNTVLNSVSGIVNTVIDLINNAINLINAIPGVHIGKIPKLSLPRLARGGVVDGATTAVIGEAGAEAVMPLENNTGWIDKLADKINASNGAGNGQPIQLTVQIGEDKVATKIIDLINEKTQMSGRNSILV